MFQTKICSFSEKVLSQLAQLAECNKTRGVGNVYFVVWKVKITYYFSIAVIVNLLTSVKVVLSLGKGV